MCQMRTWVLKAHAQCAYGVAGERLNLAGGGVYASPSELT